jgi:hypothetical protein
MKKCVNEFKKAAKVRSWLGGDKKRVRHCVTAVYKYRKEPQTNGCNTYFNLTLFSIEMYPLDYTDFQNYIQHPTEADTWLLM